jgi:hypothetical protein
VTPRETVLAEGGCLLRGGWPSERLRRRAFGYRFEPAMGDVLQPPSHALVTVIPVERVGQARDEVLGSAKPSGDARFIGEMLGAPSGITFRLSDVFAVLHDGGAGESAHGDRRAACGGACHLGSGEVVTPSSTCGARWSRTTGRYGRVPYTRNRLGARSAAIGPTTNRLGWGERSL